MAFGIHLLMTHRLYCGIKQVGGIKARSYPYKLLGIKASATKVRTTNSAEIGAKQY